MLFVSYVFGDYDKYIPYYVYGILESYPESFVKVFVHEECSDKVYLALSKIKSKNYKIINNCNKFYFSDINFTKKHIKLGNERLLRWLLPYKEFEKYKYAYIGDVDMLIVKESPSLLESHINHLQLIDYPFSNVIRPGQKRLTGLHFIDVENYFKIMNPIINKYSKNIFKFFETKPWCDNNEIFLYEIIKEGFGEYNEKILLKDNFYRPHHGMHLGLNRNVNFKIDDIKISKTIKIFESKDENGLEKYPWISNNPKYKKKFENTIYKLKNNLSLNKDDHYNINWINKNQMIHLIPNYLNNKIFKEIHNIMDLKELNDYI